jgi:hypothetical protein
MNQRSEIVTLSDLSRSCHDVGLYCRTESFVTCRVVHHRHQHQATLIHQPHPSTMIACFRPSIAPNLVRSIALGYITVSTLHFSLDSMDELTLLRSALLSRESRVSSVRLVRTSVELLITAPLQRSTNVHKRITLN